MSKSEGNQKKPATPKGASKSKAPAKAGRTDKPKVAARPKARSAAKPAFPVTQPVNPIELPEGMWERIAKKAYELYEQRGRGEGRSLEDWLKAEEMVMEEIHEARE